MNMETAVAIFIVHVDRETANSLAPSNAAWLGFLDKTRSILAKCGASKMLNEATFLLPLKSASATLGILIELTVRLQFQYTLAFVDQSAMTGTGEL